MLKNISQKSHITVIRLSRTSITLHPETSSTRKALRIAVIGPPNVGKSALTNALLNADLCAVSKRMDTTRYNTVGAITENSCQLVVVDSPGLVGIKHARDVVGAHSEATVLTDPEKAIARAEHLLVVHASFLMLQNISQKSHITVIRLLRTSITVHPETPSTRKALRIAVIGPPNVGKSALTNALLNADLCAVSKRMDTTRYNTVGAITENSCQLVVVDSPGLVGIKHARDVVGAHSEATVLTDPEKAIARAEHLLVVHASFLQSDLLELAKILTNGMVGGQKVATQPVRLGKMGQVNIKDEIKLHTPFEEKDVKWKLMYNRLMNKPTYKISWSETRKLFGNECGWPNFDQIFFVSAVTRKGIDDLRIHLQTLSHPLEGEYPMNEEAITQKKPRLICSEHIRSKILNHLPGDVAYNLRVNILEWDVSGENENARIRIVADVICDKLHWAHLLAKVIPNIEEDVSQHLRNLFAGNIEICIRAKHGRDVIGPKKIE
uniref:G domain-containing protein n=1 Tax=Panagrolaimus sp. ES5 TaxID=591445 RepID=A0AC34F4Y1_9BILA